MGKSKCPVAVPFLDFLKDREHAWVLLDLATLIVGRQFAEMEFVTCLAMVTQRWTIHLSEGWTEQQAHLAVENSAHVLTLQPVVNIPLVFKRR